MHQPFVEIDFEKVKGYKKLSQYAKDVFQRIYKSHNSCHGIEYKKDWVPKSVREHKTHLEVHFVNGEWLHYCPDGTWY